MPKKKRTSPPAPLRRGEGSKKVKQTAPSAEKETAGIKLLSRGRGVAEGRGEVLFERICSILESARTHVARSVNTTQVVANWLVGKELVENEQQGKRKAEYGKRVIEKLSALLVTKYGGGYSATNLKLFRQLYHEYPDLLSLPIGYALRDEFGAPVHHADFGHAASDESKDCGTLHALRGKSDSEPRKSSMWTDTTWKPGILSSDLSWTHYRTLLKVSLREARDFYEIEARKNNWSARQLERQINSLLYERLLKSRDKKGVKTLANKGLEPAHPIDTIKGPYVLEFLDLPEAHQLVESKVEDALITRLLDFLLELGTGFAFISRQKRLTLDGDHFYSDLVFYHVKLKCYLVIDLKTAKLTHGDLGQMQMYVNYFDREVRSDDDNPTIGLILCTAKNDAMVKYVLDDKNKQIFASRYQFTLPTEEELKKELKHEMVQLGLPAPADKKSRRKKNT